MCSAMGFTAWPQYPPLVLSPPTRGSGTKRSMSTPMMLLMVLMSETPCAPPRFAARPCGTMLATFGVSFTSTGIVEYSTAHEVISWLTLGSWPTAEPMPRSHMPWGQPKLSSSPSAPVSTERLMMSRHSSRLSTISDTITACFGYFFLVSSISRKFTSRGRSVMSSMLLKPTCRAPVTWCAPKRLDTFWIGVPRVFHTAPPQPASKARCTCAPEFAGGAEASQKGLGDRMPPVLLERSVIARSRGGTHRSPSPPACPPPRR